MTEFSNATFPATETRDKIPFLVHGRIERTQYMRDPEGPFEDWCIVMARTENEAYDKYHTMWSKKTDAYCVYYRVASCNVFPTLL